MPRGPERKLFVALLFAEAVIAVAIVSVFDGIGASASPRPGAEGPPQRRTLETGATPRIVVNDRYSTIEVVAWDATRVEIEDRTSMDAIAGRRLAALEISQHDDEISIVRPTHASRIFYYSRGGRGLVLHVPRAARLDIERSSGASLRGLHGAASVKASNARIAIADHDADIEAASSNGRITFENVRADRVSANTSNASLNFEHVRARSIEASTSNASVNANDVAITGSGARGSFITSNAAIAFAGSLAAPGAYQFHSSNAAIRLALPLDSNLTVNAAARRGGITASAGFAFSGDQRDGDRVATLGAGLGSVSVVTSNASVTLEGGQSQHG